jgi:transcriptional regulator with XRE-family HTH domain
MAARHHIGMPPRTHTLGEAHRFLDWLRVELGKELRISRHAAGATMAQVAARLGWSKSKVSRVERGRSPSVTLKDLALFAAVVGLRPSVRLYPSGLPIRDIGQVQLLAALTMRMHPSWRHRHEVPMPRAGDLRAADQVSTIPGCSVMIEAFRRFTDYQAQSRSAREKQRDLGADRLLLLIEDTETNRRALRAVHSELRRSFPVSPRRMLAGLAAGEDPGGDGVLLLRRHRGPHVAPRATKPDPTAPRSVSAASGATFRE